MTSSQHREERLIKQIEVALSGSNNAKSKIVVEYRELRIYVHLFDCLQKITWRFEYDNVDDQLKLESIVKLFTNVQLNKS